LIPKHHSGSRTDNAVRTFAWNTRVWLLCDRPVGFETDCTPL